MFLYNKQPITHGQTGLTNTPDLPLFWLTEARSGKDFPPRGTELSRPIQEFDEYPFSGDYLAAGDRRHQDYPLFPELRRVAVLEIW